MDIKDHYSIELDKIRYCLTSLENGHTYELARTPGTASCAAPAKHLRDNLNSLLNKIENNKPGVAEKATEASQKMQPCCQLRRISCTKPHTIIKKGSVAMAPALAQVKSYTIVDIYSLPEGSRAELIDGQMYYMAPPSRRHQDILSFLHLAIGNHIAGNNGECKVYPAPFAVFLSADDSKYLEPDISVVCDKHKLNDHGCNGAPDWIIEIVSPSSRRMDYYTKLSLYRSANVREYWIVDPMKQTILVYDMEHDSAPAIYSFADNIKVNIYDDLWIDFRKLDL